MNLITQSKFKDLLGITKQAVSQLVKNGNVTSVKKGRYPQIDLDGALTQQYLLEREEKTSDSDREFTPSDLVTGNLSEKKVYEIEKLKEQIEDLKIKNEQKRGNLIEKKLVEILFGKMYQIDEDQLKQAGVDISKRSLAIFNERNKSKSIEILELIKTKSNIQEKDIQSLLNADQDKTSLSLISMYEDIASGVLKSVQSEIDTFLENLSDE